MNAQSTGVLDDPATRVTLWELPPESRIDSHVHEFPYCVVPVRSGTLTIIDDTGARSARRLVTGQPYTGAAGTRHSIENRGDVLVAFLEVESRETSGHGSAQARASL